MTSKQSTASTASTSTENSTASTSTASTPLHLGELARNIALSSGGVKKQWKETGKPVIISASKLAARLPQLKVFGDLPFIRIHEDKEGENLNGYSLSLALSDDGKPGVFTPNSEPVDGVEVVSWLAGTYSVATIQKDGEKFEIDFKISDTCKQLIGANDGKDIEGKNLPPIEYLTPVFRHSSLWHLLYAANKTEIYELVRQTTPDPIRHKTNRWIISDSAGAFYTVYENSSLRKLIKKHGSKVSFKIASIKEEKKPDPKTKVVTTKRYVTLQALADVADYEELYNL